MSAGDRTPAVRVPVPVDEKFNPFDLKPGEYAGPATGWTGDLPAVWFVLPTESVETGGLRHVVSPPHVFRECSDGSLEIRESLGCHGRHGEDGFVWHGYLDEGNVWREV